MCHGIESIVKKMQITMTYHILFNRTTAAAMAWLLRPLTFYPGFNQLVLFTHLQLDSRID